MTGKPVKTETTIKQYDADDVLVFETVTITTQAPVVIPDPPSTGMYL